MKTINAWRKPEEIDPDAKNLFNIPDVKIPLPTDEEIQKQLRKSSSPIEKNVLKPVLRNKIAG